MDLAARWGVTNIRFGVWNLLQKSHRKYDAVASTEVLEHIESASLALGNKVDAANLAVYSLVPYATKATNADAEKRLNAFRQHEHFVRGYDSDFFSGTGARVDTSGVYWKEAGLKFRQRLEANTLAEIELEFEQLLELSDQDLIGLPPSDGQCLGIKSVILT